MSGYIQTCLYIRKVVQERLGHSSIQLTLDTGQDQTADALMVDDEWVEGS